MTGDIVQIAVHSAIGLAMVVYVPYAFSITLRNRSLKSDRPFDHAGGEVGYLAITIAAWLASFIWAIFVVSVDDICVEWYNRQGYWYGPGCATSAAMAALALIQLIISSVWLGMIVWLVLQVTDQPRGAVYRVSVNRLLRGREARVRTDTKDGSTEYQELDEMRGQEV